MLPVPYPSDDPEVGRQVADTRALRTFDEAALATLRYLQSQVPAGAWMVTRVAGDDWVVLRALAPGYAVQDGDVLRWSDSMCSRMVRAQGPRVAPDSRTVPAYAAAPIAAALPIVGYVGIPLTGADGALLGTLCAIDPAPLPDHVLALQPLLELQARLLSGLLDLELRALRLERGARAALAADLGALDASARELARYACPTSVLVLDGLGPGTEDELLASLSAGELAVRLDGQRCAALLPEVPVAVAEQRATRLVEQLHRRGLSARVGVGTAVPGTGDLRTAVAQAQADLDDLVA